MEQCSQRKQNLRKILGVHIDPELKFSKHVERKVNTLQGQQDPWTHS